MGTLVVLALAGCAPSSTQVAPPSPKVQESPILPDLGLPADTSPLIGNSQVAAGDWGFVSIQTENTSTESLVGVRVNGIWAGSEGALADHKFDSALADQVSLPTATPFYLSYSYVVVSGDPKAMPQVNLLPTVDGTLYEITSALVGGRKCPDQPGPTERGLGREVRVCLVAISDNGARPTGLSRELPNTDPKQYLFWNANDPEALPAIETPAS